MHVQEEAAPVGLHQTGLAGPERSADRLSESARHCVSFADNAVAPFGKIRDMDDSAPRTAFAVEFLEIVRVHSA